MELDSCRGRGPKKFSIQRPELAVRKQRGSQEVRIDPTDAEAPKLPDLNPLHNFLMGCGNGGRERFEIAQNTRSILQMATRQLPHDERMHHHQGCAK